MRIISPFSDYYDGCRAYGIDDKITYVRRTQKLGDHIFSSETLPVVDVIRKQINKVSELHGSATSDTYSVVYVGFCGKIYAGLKFLVDTAVDMRTPVNMSSPTTVAQFAWQAGDLSDEELDKNIGRWWRKTTVRDWFETSQLTVEHTDLFHALNTPVFVVDGWHIYSEPKLTDYKFQRRLDPFTAFQELSMFLGGVLNVGDPAMEEISDADRIAQHGFDKRSFRKDPTKRAS